MRFSRLRGGLLASAPLVLALGAPAHAGATQCASLDNPLYLQIGDTQQPLIKKLGRALRDNAGNPITLVYVTSGSCANIESIRNGTPIVTNLNYIPSAAENPGWLPSDPPLPCAPPVGGVVPDVANSNVFVSACTSTELPATIGTFEGATQAYVMAVPELSSQTAITYAEAYFAFGFGMPGLAMPWVDESQMYIRTPSKSTLVSWALNIGVPPAAWHGIMNDTSTQVVTGLQNSPSPESAIGILGAEIYDANRDTLDVLAYKAAGQYFAYYPDSTVTSLDKRNVRDGHYTVWSPTLYMTNVNGAGAPSNADADYLIGLLQGAAVTPEASFDPVAIVASVGLVPTCAMGVTRSFEGGPLSYVTPDEPCGCEFDALVDTTTCAACDDATPCADGVCRGGYCEAQ